MNNVMVDLETLDVQPSAVVLSVGMVPFDFYKGPLGKGVYFVLSRYRQEENGRTVSPDTAAWWSKQTAPATDVLLESTNAYRDVASELRQIADYMGPNPAVWGNGADFDNTILASLYRTFKVQLPWSHRNSRCYRTVKALAEQVNPHMVVPKRLGVAHNALDDAFYQAACFPYYAYELIGL